MGNFVRSSLASLQIFKPSIFFLVLRESIFMTNICLSLKYIVDMPVFRLYSLTAPPVRPATMYR